ncbi:MAG TPA: cellulase family glycosylhydrolase [Candidatus Gastranaerophilales bacterium]|nr:cellulase family glycosylhydrolase [Candidatus Gastranaerophilales bacterium]
MKKFILAMGIIAVGLLGMNASYALNPIPKGIGVNFHFTGAPAKDLDMIKNAGFNMARTDLKWDAVERVKGQYNWTAYDQLIDGLISRGIVPYMILDYNNGLYGAGVMDGISSTAGIQGYTNFAKATVAHYKGKKIIWEIWNEPNLDIFWRPTPNATNYMNLVKAAVPAMRTADPNAIIVAPGVAFVANTFDYLKQCAAQGLFNYVDGVSVHPYKNDAPENGSVDYLYSALRDILKQYGKPDLPIVGGEFGFSTAWSNVSNEQTQAEFLVRQLVWHDYRNIPVSIVYDFRNDGTDPNNVEHNFGTVRNDYSIKPAYNAIKTLRTELNGWTYSKKLPSAANEYIFEYLKGTSKKAAAWTTGTAHNVTIYGKSISLSKMPVYVPDGTTAPVDPPVVPPTDPPVIPPVDCTTAPVLDSARLAVKQATGVKYATLQWQDRSTTETGFDIYQSINNTDNFKVVNSMDALCGVRQVKLMVNMGTAPVAGTYYYKVVAKYADGSINASNIKSLEVKSISPNAPSNLTSFVTKSTSQKPVVLLKWMDKSLNEDGFNIYFSTALAGPYEKVGTADKNAVNVVHWVEQKGSFFYQVKSFNASGESTSLMTVPVVIN